jgi:hypothetical protein
LFDRIAPFDLKPFEFQIEPGDEGIHLVAQTSVWHFVLAGDL